jgi:NAD-dependent dihydropyrimidine dehydrogenase PreA subunit
MPEAQYATGKHMSCFGCGEIGNRMLGNPNLCPTRTLLFCPSDAKLFWHRANWVVARQPRTKLIQRPIKCVGCEIPVLTCYVNSAVPVPIAFCRRCQGLMENPRMWEEFHRNVRDEDLAGYAPNILGIGDLGSEVTQR